MKLDMEVGLGPRHIVLDGDPPPLSKRGTAPQFSAHVCCSQTAGWIKMSLGMEVGLDPGDTVLHGNPAPREQGHNTLPLLSSPFYYYGETAGWIKMPLVRR